MTLQNKELKNYLNKFEKAKLFLIDGTIFEGFSFGSPSSCSGEVVFQTGMVGYPESFTDPSFKGQILVLTYPLIGNYGVPSWEETDQYGLSSNFESGNVHIEGLIVQNYSENYSHWKGVQSLGDFLKKRNITAIFGIDTRALTVHLREKGTMIGKIIVTEKNIPFHDSNPINLVAKVCDYSEPKHYTTENSNFETLRVLIVDLGMKFNQIRCFLQRHVNVSIVPWNYDFPSVASNYDGLFLSNGPGDPQACSLVIDRLKRLLLTYTKPIFGICLGHQLLALASNATIYKMKYGNRGLNIPCMDLRTQKCYITSQNHGYCVEESSLSNGWKALFRNVNDNTNEGIFHTNRPFFSVQFHPEACPGPTDTLFLFDDFINLCRNKPLLLSPIPKYVHQKLHKVVILGSGGLSIGQAGEFDYSGSQCIKALKEEKIITILINPNIATIQTSKSLADKVYFLPITPEFVLKVIKTENPDGILVTFGGQTALNCSLLIENQLKELNCTILGTPMSAIRITEDRELFSQMLNEIQIKCAPSGSASTVQSSIDIANNITHYPVIIRSAYSLGGFGSGFANNEEELRQIASSALTSSPQILVESSLKGWKEIEYEVVRDSYDNCVVVCNMENFDPLGIHTGDSIVVAPSQTLNDREYQMLRNTAIKTIRHLGIIGECNIQYALSSSSDEYYVIEVNARLSRSSALASKATGYPLAFVAAKLALGFSLTELKNNVTMTTSAGFEPSFDYCAIKFPYWDLSKFHRVSNKVGSSMKSVGESMSVGRSFPETFQKAIRSIDENSEGFQGKGKSFDELDEELKYPSYQRIFAIAMALERNYSVENIHRLAEIDKWFLFQLKDIIDFTDHLKLYSNTAPNTPENVLLQAKKLGFSDKQISDIINTSELSVRKMRKKHEILPTVKQIDTVSAEFPSYTNYLYMTYHGISHDISFEDNGVIVLGSGVYRIGSSVEFDWCAVTAVKALRENGFKTIMINYNPETVSTDYDEVDRLYFENIRLETCLDIYELEQSLGILLSMGGQIANNIAMKLYRNHVRIFGTSPVQIDMAENRYKFSRLLDSINVDQPQWKELTSYNEATSFSEEVEYPVLVRPSYVLSGAAMSVVHSKNELFGYLESAVAVSRKHPVVISKFIENAKEIELDAVALNGVLLMHVVSEHIEHAGVHSGDATIVFPSQGLNEKTIEKVVEAASKISEALNVTGPMNIQFIAINQKIKVIECNLRASRSFPFVSKCTNVNLIEMSVQAMMNLPITYPIETSNTNRPVAVKVSQFSFDRLSGADPVLGVEMTSTGEVACFGRNIHEAYLKGLISIGLKLPTTSKNILISIGSYKEKHDFLPFIKKLYKEKFTLFASPGTADYIMEHGIKVNYVDSFPLEESFNTIIHLLKQKHIDLYICLPSKFKCRRPLSYISRGYITRRAAVDFQIPLITNINCAKLLVDALIKYPNPIDTFTIQPYDCISSLEAFSFPGIIDVFLPYNETLNTSHFLLAGGITLVHLCCATSQSDCPRPLIPSESYVDFVLSTENFSDSVGIVLKNSDLNNIGLLSQIFDWNRNQTIFATASGVHLASLLFLSKIFNRKIHCSQILKHSDTNLIQKAKKENIKVTCDTNPLALFLTKEKYEKSHFYQLLDNFDEVDLLWKNLNVFDCFSLGKIGSLQPELYQKSLTLLMMALSNGLISKEDFIKKTNEAPRQILGVGDQSETFVEVLMKQNRIKNLENEIATLDDVVFGENIIERIVLRGATVWTRTNYNRNKKPIGKFIPVIKDSLPLKNEFSQTTKEIKQSTTQLKSSNSSVQLNLQSLNVPLNLSTSIVPNKVFHCISVLQFSRSFLHNLFELGQYMRTNFGKPDTCSLLKGNILINLFYEVSTRTSSSFQAAMERLGGTVISIQSSSSSSEKGESLEDSIMSLENYGDIIVLRHPEPGSSVRAANVSSVPIINAGDGNGEHPTQAFLDIFTIREELGTVNGLTITFVGDLKNSRTVHSLIQLLRFYTIKLNLVSHESLKIPKQYIQQLIMEGITINESTELETLLDCTDVLYVTRVQKERFDDLNLFNNVKGIYRITPEILTKCKEKMILMHPLPRVDEIDSQVDYDSRAVYFRQMKYGLYIRMAILMICLRTSFQFIHTNLDN